MSESSLRHWAILRLLPRNPDSISTGQIIERLNAQGIKTTIRTIQRDLNSLSISFPLISDDSRPQGWAWAKDVAQLEFPALTAQAALTFLLAQSVMNNSLSAATISYLKPWFSAAKEKLIEFGNPDELVAQKFRVVSRMPSLIPPKVDPCLQTVVYRGLLLDRQIEINYQSREASEIKKYIIDPFGIAIIDCVCYLICKFHSHHDLRTIALHRIKSALLLDSVSMRPKDFDIDSYIEEGNLGILRGSELFSLEFLMKNKWAYHLYETPLASNQVIKKINQDWTKITVVMPNTNQIRWWLRSFGADVQVLRPASLRDEFVAEAEAMREFYNLNSNKNLKKVKMVGDSRESMRRRLIKSQEELNYKNDFQDIISTEDSMINSLEKIKEFEKKMKSKK